MRRLRSPEGGPYSFRLSAYITNEGRSTFKSDRGQTLVRVKDGGNTLKAEPWPGRDPIELPPGDLIDKVFIISEWEGGTGEFATEFVIALSYGPDTAVDGNPDNDDCKTANNKVEVTSEQLRDILAGSTVSQPL